MRVKKYFFFLSVVGFSVLLGMDHNPEPLGAIIDSDDVDFVLRKLTPLLGNDVIPGQSRTGESITEILDMQEGACFKRKTRIHITKKEAKKIKLTITVEEEQIDGNWR